MQVRDRVLDLRRVKASDLRANPKNWRRHPQTQAVALRSVLEKVGYAGALLARETPEGLELIDGHLRQEISGSQEVPVLVVDLDDAEADLILATLDPLGAMAQTDEQALYDLLQDVIVPDDVLARALEEMTGQAGPPAVMGDPDAIPDLPAEPSTTPGDLYLLGEHRLLCGDSSDPAALDRLYTEKVGCVLTDPPYGIDLDTDYRKMGPGISEQVPNGQSPRQYRRVEGDAEPFDAGPLRTRFRGTKEQFWFGANYYRRTLSGDDLDGSWLVWDKRKEGADDFAGSAFELVWSAQPHKQDLLRFFWFGMFGNPEARERLHPTQKPTALLEEILTRWAPKGCIVADPFAGSGSALLAAEKTGRRAHLVEIDPAYCDVIVARWEAFTGQSAERAA